MCIYFDFYSCLLPNMILLLLKLIPITNNYLIAITIPIFEPILISFNIIAEPGPYREKAKTIYQELRSNLIRYVCCIPRLCCFHVFQTIVIVIPLQQKCCRELSQYWVSMGAIWSKEWKGKRCEIYGLDSPSASDHVWILQWMLVMAYFSRQSWGFPF